MANIDSLEIQINASSDKASDAISKLITSLEKLDSALSKLNVKEFADQMSKVSTSMSKMSKSASTTGEKLQNMSRNTHTVSNAFRFASTASGGFMSSLKRMIPQTKSLTSAFMGLYAKLFLIRKLFSLGFKAIDIASDLTEVQNVVDITFGDMAGKLEDFAKTSRQTFGLSELSAKQYASQFQSMFKAMGLSAQQVSEVNSRLAEDSVSAATMMSKGYDVMSNDVSDMSLNLTKLAADMASFYNQEAADTAARLQAGVISGQSRALRQYGLDLTMATLQEYALSKGIQADIQSMTQAQKTMLRYQYAMERLSHVQGDFARTINTWANQVKLLKQNFQALGSIIGSGLINAFKPAIMKINSAMNTLIKLVEKAMNAIGKLLGWQVEISEVGVALDDMDEALEGSGGGGGGSGGTADDLEDAADGAEDAADGADDLADGLNKAKEAAKKLKDYTFGIDELNIFHADEEVDDLEDLADAIDDVADKNKKANDGGGSGGGASGGGSGASMPVSGGGVSYRSYESDIDSWFELGRRISDTLASTLESIDWNSIYEKARNFGKGLAEFLNGLITPRLFADLGMTIASALNTALNFLDSFGETFDWKNLGHSIAVGINNFFKTFDFELAASTFNKLADGILTSIITALSDTEWYTIGQKIGEFISNIDFKTLLSDVGRLIWEAINAAFELYEGIFDAAPLETALGTIGAVLVVSHTNWGRDLVKIIGGAIKNVKDAVLTIPTAFDKMRSVYQDSGSPIMGLNAGLGTVHDKLKTTTKFVGGAVTAFLQFNNARSAVRNIATDTGDVVTELFKIGGGTLAAITSFSLLTGSLKTGALLGLLSTLAGSLAGICQAFEEISRLSGEKAFKGMIDATSSASKSIQDLEKEFQDVVEGLTTDIAEFNSKFSALDESKGKINDIVQNINGIAIAWEATNTATEGQLETLKNNLGELSSLMSEYINSQYDLAIQQATINAKILSATGELNEGEKQVLGERIANLYAQRDAAIDTSNAQIKAMQDASEAYNSACEAYGKGSEEAQTALTNLVNTMVDFNGYAESIGASTDELSGALKAMKASADDAASSTEGISTKLNLASDGIGGFTEEVDNIKSVMQSMTDTFSSGQAEIEAYRNSVIEGVDTAASIAEKQTAAQEALDQMTAYYLQGFGEIQDTVVAGVSDVVATAESEWEASGGKIFGFANKAEYVQNAINEYVTNFVEPLDSEMKTQMEQLGIDQQTYALDACKNIANALFDVEVIQGANGIPQVKTALKDNWKDILDHVGKFTKDRALSVGREVTDGLNEGVNSEEEWGKMRHSTSTHVQGLTTEIETQLDSGKANTIGSNFIAGLKAGLSKIEEVTGQARAVAKGIADATRSELQISSPSKVAESIGQYFIDGLMSPMDVLKVTVKIMLFAAGLVSKFKELLKPELFQPIGSGMVDGLIAGLTEALPNLWTAITDALTLLFTEILPPYFMIDMWLPLFTMLHETFVAQFELFRLWFTDEAMTLWWNEDLKTWFTWEKWNPDVFQPIVNHYKKAWKTFIEWWKLSMKKEWWEDNVKPWFTEDQWFPDVFDMIESHYTLAWEEFLNWWRTSMEEWWRNDVIPWFEHDKWYEQFEHIYDAAEAVFEAVAEVIREKMQEAEDACREACAAMMEMINEVIEAADAAIAKMEQLMSMAASIGSIGVGIPGFAAGGFPSTGSLFIANEAGPELVGSINGHTAVASHGEITGIREAVLQTGNVETQLLTQIIGLAQQLLDKDPVVLGDREIAQASNRGREMLGLSLIS